MRNKFNIPILKRPYYSSIGNYIYHGFFYKNRNINYIRFGIKINKYAKEEI